MDVPSEPQPLMNHSLSFDGIDDYVEIPKSGSLNLDGSSAFTVQLHIYNTALPGSPTWRQLVSNTGTLTSCGLGDNGGFNIRYGADGGAGPYAHSFSFMTDEKHCFNASEVMAYEEWQELSVVYDGATLEFFYDGVSVGSQTVTGNFDDYDGSLIIGKGTDGNMGDLYFPGKFDNLRIWNVALTQSEIQSHGTELPIGNEEGLVGFWNFDDGEGNVLTDLSGNGNNGTIYGATWSEDVPEPSTCDFTEVTVNLYDSYGDGWNGNVLTIGQETLELFDGFDATINLCLQDGTYLVTCEGGSWQSEISWEILAQDGSVLLAGGSPYYGDPLQIGDIPEVLGCTDPGAYNYDETATVDDGSCYYDGDQCQVAHTAVLGENQSDGEDEFFQYTATLNGIMTVSSQNEYGDAIADTDLSIHDGDCESLELLTAIDGTPAANDDCCGYYGPSTVHVHVTQGTVYTILWSNSWNPGPFTWYLNEEATAPQDLVAIGGVQHATLEWQALANESAPAFVHNINQPERGEGQLIERYLEKKSQLVEELNEIRISGVVNPDYSVSSRATSVIIECDGGDWQSEVSWEILDATDVVIASGGAPSGALNVDLEDGTYTLKGYDSYGDGWNGNYLIIYDENYTYLNWTLDEGDEGSVTFSVPMEEPNLTLSNLMFDQNEDLLSVDVTNTGEGTAFNVSLGYYFGDASSDCNNETVETVMMLNSVSSGETVTYAVTGLETYLGYGTHNVGIMVDYYCEIDEIDENDNLITGTIEIEDPLNGVAFNVYRSFDDGNGSYSFNQIGVEIEGQQTQGSTMFFILMMITVLV